MYKQNPKTAGSGIICAIPQTGVCPNACPDCFFQAGRSYLEPLSENLPNLPPYEEQVGRIVRINDGNDSNVDRERVVSVAQEYGDYFFNTAIPKDLKAFPGPVVVTINPGKHTNTEFFRINHISKNLMFVRFRTNTWNLELLRQAIEYYTGLQVPVVITFLAYFQEDIPEDHEHNYSYRQRTMNSYWVILPGVADQIAHSYCQNPYVYTCGKDANTFTCQRCGNCIREYYNTKERLRANVPNKPSMENRTTR